MSDYGELIEGCVEDFMASGEFEAMVRRRVAKCMEDAIEDSFRWGELRDAVKAKVKGVLVPYIERCDMEAYTAKLDVLLAEIAEHTALADNKRILENFGALMTEPEKHEVSLEEVFEAYKKFVAKAATGDGLEVVDGSYACVDVSCDVVERCTRGLGFQWEEAVVRFTADVPEEGEREELACEVVLHSSHLEPGKFRLFRPAIDPTVDSLVRMSGFEVFLARLDRGFVKIVDVRDFADEIAIDAEPEYELV